MTSPRSNFPVVVDQIELHVVGGQFTGGVQRCRLSTRKAVCSYQRKSVFFVCHWKIPEPLLRSGDWPFKPDNAFLDDLKKGTDEERSIHTTAESLPKIPQWENLSTFKKLQRIMATVLRILPKHSHFRTPDRSIFD